VGFLLTFNLMLTSWAATSPRDALARYTFSQYHMGVDARLVIYAPNQEAAEKAGAAAFARIAALDSIMSDYRRDSELMRLCARAGGPPIRVSPDLFLVLQRAQKVSRESNGAFDVTVGPLIALWRAARKTAVLPAPAEIERARRLVGWKKVRLNQSKRTVQLTVRGMKLDLGGIGKGYAADEAQRVLKKHGIKHALVEMGGDIVVSSAPPGTEGWTIRVPNAGNDPQPTDRHFADRALSTSGDTEQFVVIGGRRYSHIIDPRTGQALTKRVQVTVIAPNGLTSDPLSKVVSILSEQDRNKLLKSYPGTTAFVRVLPLD
jgi:FAD:protein FMN transferase